MEDVTEAIHKMPINEEFTIDMVKIATDKQHTEAIKEAFDLSNQISSALAALMKGNPRHCKRFFNTLMMRIALADRREIKLQKKVLAKLMLAEYYKPSFFEALMQPKSKDELKQLESNSEESSFLVIKDWSNDEWVQKWAKGEPALSKVEDLRNYFYFSRFKIKIY